MIHSMEPKEPKNVKIQIFDKSLEICQKNLKKQEFLSLNFPSPVILRVWEDTRRCVGGSAGPVCKMAAQMSKMAAQMCTLIDFVQEYIMVWCAGQVCKMAHKCAHWQTF